MKIDSASYSLAASHLATSHDETRESLRAWVGARRPDFEARGSTSPSAVSLSSAARAALAAEIRDAMSTPPAPQTTQPAPAPDAAAIDAASDAVDNDPYLRLIKFLVEMLTGKPITGLSARELRHPDARPSMIRPEAAVPDASPRTAPARPAGFGIEYDYHSVHEEFEQTRISAEGSIKTADGREISFTLGLSLTRSYREETSLSLRVGDAVRRDPLVLNFNGAAAQLSDRHFRFDLDDDGATESVALLAGGSGYLAIDRNDNGRIDSGHELFGPATGSGFGELSSLDSDGNRWIDENDNAFGTLRIWIPDAEGGGKLETLAKQHIGAIAVDHVASPFELRGAGNSNLGAIAASAVFIAEDGHAGTIQELDLTV